MPSFPPGQIGVNLAGAEFGTRMPGTYDVDYMYPYAEEYDYYDGLGLTLIRLPFRWERVQPTLGGPLDATQLGHLDQQVAMAEARGMKIVLDVHNYGRYVIRDSNGVQHTHIIGASDGVVTSAHFSDLWKKLATHFNGETTIWAYGLMNEPHDMGATPWATIAQGAVNAIRTVDTGHTILIAGDCWSGAWTWKTCNNGLILSDSANKLVYEAHQYFDSNGSGGYANGYDGYPEIGVDRLQPFLTWLAENNLKGFIGEFGAPNNDPRWQLVVGNFLEELIAAGVPATAWSGGPWWPDDYILRLDPVNGQEMPTITTIKAYIRRN
jgi:endoglucanase